MIYQLVNNIKKKLISVDGINQVGFGPIERYNQKEVRYPYVNMELNYYSVNDYTKRYYFTFYFMDRGYDQYTTYNKCQLLAKTFFSDPELEIEDYNLNYFYLDFRDQISGVYSQINLYGDMNVECQLDNTSCQKYILTEFGDYIKLEDEMGYILVNDTCIIYDGQKYILTEEGYYILLEEEVGIINRD